MGASQRSRQRIWLIALCGFALTLVAAPAAWAEPTDPFTPALSVSTTTTQAGAHPDLTIEMTRPYNHCLEPANPDSKHPCTTLYIQQNLEKEIVHVLPGLVADANAAPYCDPYLVPDAEGHGGQDVWACKKEDARVGVVWIVAQWCDLAIGLQASPPYTGCFDSSINAPPDPPMPPVPSGGLLNLPGVIYNDRPRTTGPYAGEQGHLVIIWPQYPKELWEALGAPPDYFNGGEDKTDISVGVRNSDLGVDAVADYIPDVVPLNGGFLAPGQIPDLVLTLEGSTGLNKGHPLLTNPTFCDPQSVDASFQGYAHNSYLDPNTGTAVPNHTSDLENGIFGKTATDSVPYQATGCDSVPYDPELSMSLDNSGPDQPPAITSTVSQAQGEATTKKVTVSFPKAFKINDKNKSTFCSESDIAASVDDPGDQDHCAESSRIGTVEASSPLLPIGQTLKGNVYLGGLSGDSIKVTAVLHGFIDLRIDAGGTISQDNRLVTTFDNLPAVPIGQFKLNLEGGDKGLIKTPKVCAPQSVTSTFQSHSGKTATIVAPVDITGCGDPTLDATLSSRRPGAPTDLDLDLHSKGTRLKDVQLLLARQLHWQVGQASAAKAKGRSIGSVGFTTSTGELETALAAKRTKSGGIKLSALAPRTPSGQLGASAVSSFAGNLFRTTKRQTRRKAKGKRNARAFTPQAELDLFGLPQDDLTAVDLGLKSKGNFSLRNPKGCGKPLNFVAFVTTADDRHLALKDQVRLKGRRC